VTEFNPEWDTPDKPDLIFRVGEIIILSGKHKLRGVVVGADISGIHVVIDIEKEVIYKSGKTFATDPAFTEALRRYNLQEDFTHAYDTDGKALTIWSSHEPAITKAKENI